MSNVNAQWWYERGGAQAGPVTFAVLQQLATTGELKPSTLVWTAGMAGWARAETIAQLPWPSAAAASPQAPAPAPGAPPAPAPAAELPPVAVSGGPAQATPAPAAASPWGAQPAGSAAEAVQPVGDVNVAATILLSIVTLTIYGVVKFYQTGKGYERLVGRETRFTTWFWCFVGTAAGSALLRFGSLGKLLAVAAIVFEFLTLYEALKARNAGMHRWALRPAVTSDTTHYVLLALGLALSPIVVGVVLLIVQAMKWFQDWNAIRAAALQRTPAPTAAAPMQPLQRTS